MHNMNACKFARSRRVASLTNVRALNRLGAVVGVTMLLLSFLSISLLGCADLPYAPGKDADGDGYLSSDGDCDDADAAIHPNQTERCDGIDNNCDKSVDETITVRWFADLDGDGHGTEGDAGVLRCDPPAGYVITDDDCDDSDATVFPGALDRCDGIDNDCNNLIDETQTYYFDGDGDGFGDINASVEGCAPGADYVAYSGDCDDQSTQSYPGAIEICDGLDNDCDGQTDDADLSVQGQQIWYLDGDGDGFGDDTDGVYACLAPNGRSAIGGDCKDNNGDYYPGATEDCADTRDLNCDGFTGTDDHDGDGYAACEECNDGNGDISPIAEELCDNIDDNCNGILDDNPTDAPLWYADTDGDGAGDPQNVLAACTQPVGYTSQATDCNDQNANDHLGADEYCDGYDNNCDGTIDEASAVDVFEWYPDQDRDGWGVQGATVLACIGPAGTAPNTLDCDDTNPQINPDSVWYIDSDGDGYGDSATATTSCVAPVDGVLLGNDCDESDIHISPAAIEICDAVDNDCNLATDEAGSVGELDWYADTDGDGYGNIALVMSACVAPAGYVASGDDCNDAAVTAYPGGLEVCGDGYDNDCNGSSDGPDASDAQTGYPDSDGDGYGNQASPVVLCDLPNGLIADGSDCDDALAAVHPGATESCNGVDDDCDGLSDESGSVGESTWYLDQDGDGYGVSTSILACTKPNGYAAVSTDCDDTLASRYPSASEYCNGVDDNCDGTVDNSAVDGQDWYIDADGDSYGSSTATAIRSCSALVGYALSHTDCNDINYSAHPSADELCDGYDNDCDGLVDPSTSLNARDWTTDGDGDGYGSDSTAIHSCNSPGIGRITTGGDCNDSTFAIHPNAAETWYDGIDSDCDNLDNPDVCTSRPLDSTVSYDATCAYAPSVPSQWSVGIEWTSDSMVFGTFGLYERVTSAPIVGQLDDDNSDGSINTRDIPDYIFMNSNTTAASTGCVRVMRGDILTERSSYCTGNATIGYPYNQSSLATGDVDADGTPEILFFSNTGYLRAIRTSGAIKWSIAAYGASVAYPISLTDLTGDGIPEIIAGYKIYQSSSNSATLITTLSTNCTNALPVDVDNDGDQDILCGGMLYTNTYGTLSLSWSDSSHSGGYPGILDYDGDGAPEYVQSLNGYIYFYETNTTGSPIFSQQIGVGTTTSGLPVVADFTNDGKDDIGVSANGTYVVYGYNAGSPLQLWSVTGLSQMLAGSTAYDLTGDGTPEVIYADRDAFYIYDVDQGSSAAPIYSNNSFYGVANSLAGPVVVDGDNDGNVEILLPAADASNSSNWTGLVVLGDSNDNWGSGPRVWNQLFSYDGVVDEDLSIPTTQPAFWLGHGLRASIAPDEDSTLSADLSLSILGGCESCGTTDTVTLYVSVENVGAVAAGPDTTLSVFADDGGVLTLLSTQTLDEVYLPGDLKAPIAITLNVSDLGTDGVWVSVDEDGAVNECDESNNTGSWNEAVCL